MKHLNLTHTKTALITSSVALLASASITANAANIKSTGLAATVCKTHVKANTADYKSSKLVKAKRIKKMYQVRMKVITKQGTKSIVQCNVARDGSIDYSVI